MDPQVDIGAAGIAAAIGEPARAKMLYCLLDGRARTATELAIVAEICPSTASMHLARLKKQHLVKVLIQGKHRYYSLEEGDVPRALEALSVVAGAARYRFTPSTPEYLRAARSCYDHMAGLTAVRLRDRLEGLEWLRASGEPPDAYELTEKGSRALDAMGIDVAAIRARRRRFAFACVDWSERRAHIGGALGDGLLRHMLGRKWFTRDLNTRALRATALGRRELQTQFGLAL
jgi:DNA-binding transcriptional ArsR family regulator